MTKYRYMVVHEGVVEADSENDAAARALFMCDGGFAETTAVQVETLERREERENEQ
jgi:hypothetical protein